VEDETTRKAVKEDAVESSKRPAGDDATGLDSSEAELAQAAQEQAAMDTFETMCIDAFEANRCLRDENERLRAELELLLALTTPESTPPATSRAAEPSS